MKNLGQSGFTAVEIVLSVALVGAIGVAGYFSYQNSASHQQATISPSATPSATSAKASTPTPASAVYAGWKSYCDTSTGGCFKYPAEWGDVSSLDSQGVKAFIHNKSDTLSVEYSEPVTGKGGLGNFVASSLKTLATPSSSYKVVGGYYTAGNIPGYNLIDVALVQQYGLVADKTSNVSSDNQLFFTKSSKATLTVHFNNTLGSSTISTAQANDWFNTADAKIALLIAQSYYNQ